MIRRVAFGKAIVAGALGALAWEALARLLIFLGIPLFDLVFTLNDGAGSGARLALVAGRHRVACDGRRDLDNLLCVLLLVHFQLAAVASGSSLLNRPGSGRGSSDGAAFGARALNGRIRRAAD
jgi:hypothetical protein